MSKNNCYSSIEEKKQWLREHKYLWVDGIDHIELTKLMRRAGLISPKSSTKDVNFARLIDRIDTPSDRRTIAKYAEKVDEKNKNSVLR